MKTSKVIFLIMTIFIIGFSKSFAKDEIDPMDVINKSCDCYVISEMMTLYSLPIRQKDLFNFYANFSTADSFIKKESEGGATYLMFISMTTEKRRELIKHVIKTGYKPEEFENLYKYLSCDKYRSIIPLQDYFPKQK